MADGGNTVPRITKSEHIGPDDTGDNIQAKRVASYVWDGVSSWSRMTQPGATGLITTSYDYVAATYPNDTTETYVFKTGGSGGTTIATITVVYTDNTKDALSSVTKT